MGTGIYLPLHQAKFNQRNEIPLEKSPEFPPELKNSAELTDDPVRDERMVHVGEPVRRIFRRVLTRQERDYSAADLELYARHIDDRARFRPEVCDGGLVCWVRQGPPAFGTRGGAQESFCIGCQGAIYTRRLRAAPK